MVSPVPVTRTDERLGALARPAGGRPLHRRHAFAVCYADQLEAAELATAETLARWAGPTRTGLLGTEAHARPTIDTALEQLADTESADTVLRLAEAVHALEATQPTRGVVLVVASCHVLWPQTARLVGLS